MTTKNIRTDVRAGFDRYEIHTDKSKAPTVFGLVLEGTGLALHLDDGGKVAVTHVASGRRLHPWPNFGTLGAAAMFALRAAYEFPRLATERDPKMSLADARLVQDLYEEARDASLL